MDADYLNIWPESYAIDRGAVRDHLYGRSRIGDPTSWRRCAEFFDGEPLCNYGICHWMDIRCANGVELDRENYMQLSHFFHAMTHRTWIWPTGPVFAPRRAALCRTVAALLEELQLLDAAALNPPATANESNPQVAAP